jgi:hypothetical protein
MTTAEVDTGVMTRQGYAFGLEIVGSFSVPHLAPAAKEPAARRVVVKPVAAHEIDRRWQSGEITSVVDRRHPDGRPFMLIDQHEENGFRVWAPHHGRYEISPDGRAINCAVPARDARWERLFFAQALPLAAALQRIGLFHASAVSIGDRAVAFVAPSGTGKTSLAAHLVDRGARLVTDDVLALDRSDSIVTAHPGSNVLCLDEREFARLQGSIGSVVGSSDKIHVSSPVVPVPLPLASIYYLERSAAFSSLEIRQLENGDPQVLLASSFITYLRSSRFLLDHLELCAHVAQTVPTFSLRVPEELGAAKVAAVLEAELR